jgi:hypothetical protein
VRFILWSSEIKVSYVRYRIFWSDKENEPSLCVIEPRFWDYLFGDPFLCYWWPLQELFTEQPLSKFSQSRWLSRVRSSSAATGLLWLRVRFRPGAWVSVACAFFVLSGRGLCDGPVTRPGYFSLVWSWRLDNTWPWPTRGTCANGKGYFMFDILAMYSNNGLFAYMIRIFEQSFSSLESSA